MFFMQLTFTMLTSNMFSMISSPTFSKTPFLPKCSSRLDHTPELSAKFNFDMTSLFAGLEQVPNNRCAKFNFDMTSLFAGVEREIQF